jgi:hypothetical protein
MDEAIKLLFENINSSMNEMKNDMKCIRETVYQLKTDFDSHKIQNGYAKKDIESLNKDIKPIRNIKAGWAVILAIIGIVGTLTFVQVKFTSIANKINSITTATESK